jgi:hypothetical protein
MYSCSIFSMILFFSLYSRFVLFRGLCALVFLFSLCSSLFVRWYRLLNAFVLFLIVFNNNVHKGIFSSNSVFGVLHVSLHVACMTSSSLIANCSMSVSSFAWLLSSSSISFVFQSLSSILNVLVMLDFSLSLNSFSWCFFILYRGSEWCFPCVVFLSMLMLNFITL